MPLPTMIADHLHVIGQAIGAGRMEQWSIEMKSMMMNMGGWRTGLALAYLAALCGGGAAIDLAVGGPAQAVVYCKTVGVPKGCIARPTAAVVYCTRPGIPVGCRVRPVARVPGVGYNTRWNRGGPVNRVGRR
jgi:hypothetical protein